MSGRRIMRNAAEEPEERREDRHEQRHLKGEVARLIVDLEDLLLDGRGLVGEQLLELRVAHHLRVIFQRLRDLLLLGGGDHGTRVRHVGERQRERREQDAAGHREAERQPERPRRRVHAGRLADALVVDRGERVVVELRHQQSETRSRDHQRYEEDPAGVGIGHDRHDQRDAHRAEREPGPDDLGRAPATGPPSGEDRDGEHRQGERSDREARLQRVVLELDLQEDRQRDHRPAERHVLQQLPGDPDPEGRELEQVRIEQGHLALAMPPHEPAGERPQRDGADRDQQHRRPHRPPATRGCPAPRRPSPPRTSPRRRSRRAGPRCTGRP